MGTLFFLDTFRLIAIMNCLLSPNEDKASPCRESRHCHRETKDRMRSNGNNQLLKGNEGESSPDTCAALGSRRLFRVRGCL